MNILLRRDGAVSGFSHRAADQVNVMRWEVLRHYALPPYEGGCEAERRTVVWAATQRVSHRADIPASAPMELLNASGDCFLLQYLCSYHRKYFGSTQ